MRKLLWLSLWLSLALPLLTACGKQMPRDVIRPKKMENVIYDYLVMQTVRDDYNSDAGLMLAGENYVWQKHGISKAQFDSSLVWYTRNTKELARIYLHIDQRLQKEHAQVKAILDQRNNQSALSAEGDSVDVWQMSPYFFLRKYPMTERVDFEVVPDSNFHPRDRFRLLFEVDYLYPDSFDLTMALSARCENDSSRGAHLTVPASGAYSIDLPVDLEWPIKTLRGFMYLNHCDTIQGQQALVHHIHLLRLHTPVDSVAIDSLAADTVKADTAIVSGQAKPLQKVEHLAEPVQEKAEEAVEPAEEVVAEPSRRDPSQMRERTKAPSRVKRRR